jgi:hypothetical protein
MKSELLQEASLVKKRMAAQCKRWNDELDICGKYVCSDQYQVIQGDMQ